MTPRYGDFVPVEFKPWQAAWGPPFPFLFHGVLMGDPNACVACGEKVPIPSNLAADGVREKTIVFEQGIQCHRCTLFREQCRKFHDQRTIGH